MKFFFIRLSRHAQIGQPLGDLNQFARQALVLTERLDLFSIQGLVLAFLADTSRNRLSLFLERVKRVRPPSSLLAGLVDGLDELLCDRASTHGSERGDLFE
ncbi:MAG: hypothetical protein KAI25_02275 [Hyphomicrobiaceae bacterium]|nr:hypothetical protein [Hyphomicrobiaceae bacterium]